MKTQRTPHHCQAERQHPVALATIFPRTRKQQNLRTKAAAHDYAGREPPLATGQSTDAERLVNRRPAWSTIISALSTFFRSNAGYEHSLSTEQVRQTDVLDAIPQPVCLRDAELRLVTCNLAYEQALGRSREALAGSTLEAVASWLGVGSDLDEVREDYRRILRTAVSITKDRTFIMNGREACVLHWAQPMRGGTRGIVAGWMDMTHRQQALKELELARVQADSANRAKSTFLASVSHEIRTPMNAIMGMLELTLSNSALSPQDKEQLVTAHQAATSLEALIGDILDLSKMEAGKFLLHPKPIDLGGLLAETVQVFRAVAQSKRLDLSLRVSGRVAATHLADPLRLKQIINNLMSNAIRFTERGKISVTLEAQPPVDGVQMVEIAVQDSGIGIPEIDIPTLCRPFVQGRNETACSTPGTGLGLSICERLAKKMGGVLTIESKPGKGTRVAANIRLPLAQAAVPVEGEPTTGSFTSVAPHGPAAARILIIDDHAANRLLLERQLQKIGHRVVCAGNGQQALEILNTNMFDLIVCDCAMPVMDGITFVRALRKLGGAQSEVPVVGCTAGAQEQYAERAREAGMVAVLNKPVSLAVLRRAIEQYLPSCCRLSARP